MSLSVTVHQLCFMVIAMKVLISQIERHPVEAVIVIVIVILLIEHSSSVLLGPGRVAIRGSPLGK